MENENQKLSFAETLKVIYKICGSTKDCFAQCPLMKQGLCIVKDIYSMEIHADEIETICTEWEMNKPTIADKINEILKPYRMEMKLMDGNNYIWFDDENMESHTKDELIDKLYTTKWKGEPNE